mmetsp:Transcript_21197/g.29979  ORF Transcript_21197/g.29979 Transcript_21197/m.29979 type:complete len:263 (+) Transcript_21197:129-917(+)
MLFTRHATSTLTKMASSMSSSSSSLLSTHRTFASRALLRRRHLQKKTTRFTKPASSSLSSASVADNKDKTGGILPLSVQDMDNTILITLSASKNHEARRELLTRHIMQVDGVTHESANRTMHKISVANEEHLFLMSLPYKLGIGASITAAAVSFPLCFHHDIVYWFNDVMVTTEVPPQEDLETMLEVGSWAWNWMEPPLGQLSFVILCLQAARAQMENLGLRPYYRWIKEKRACRLAEKFPAYNRKLIMDYSRTDDFLRGTY